MFAKVEKKEQEEQKEEQWEQQQKKVLDVKLVFSSIFNNGKIESHYSYYFDFGHYSRLQLSFKVP